MNSWREYADKLADKLMDAGNLTFGALILGQILSGQPFRWDIAALGGVAWAGFFIWSYVMLYLKGR